MTTRIPMVLQEPETYLNPRTSLELSTSDDLSSIAVLSDYREMRQKAMNDRFAEDEDRLSLIHKSTKQWFTSSFPDYKPDYSQYDEKDVRLKIEGLLEYLQENHPNDITQSEIDATKLFIDAAFGLYNAVNSGELQNQTFNTSFSFVVHGRTSRKNKVNGSEYDMIIPAFRLVSKELRSTILAGVPPFILDFYKQDEDGKRGVLICAMVSPEDLFEDLLFEEALVQANQNVNDAVDFAQKLGAETVGLGAVLPAITNYGKNVKNDKIVKTTGHGGTTVLIRDTITAAKERGFISEDSTKKIGVLGLGSIGSSIADLVGDYYKESEIVIYDERQEKIDRTLKTLGSVGINATAASSVADLFEKTDVIVSAITSPINLKNSGIKSAEGKFVVDDSQPGCIDKDEIEDLGGNVAWVIGTDPSSRVSREQWGYGTFEDANNDLFGCELETAKLFEYKQSLRDRGLDEKTINRIVDKIALNGPVTPKKARIWSAIFKKTGGIVPAQFQAFGKYIYKK